MSSDFHFPAETMRMCWEFLQQMKSGRMNRFIKVTVLGLVMLIVSLYVTNRYWPPGKLTYKPYVNISGGFIGHQPTLNLAAFHHPSETEVMSLPEAETSLECADAGKSKIFLLSRDRIELGEEIRVRVDVFRVDGKPRTEGGDEVRVWLREILVQASAAGYVIDLKNGSYLGVLRALWAGDPEVSAAIAAPLEKVRGMYRLYRKYNTLRDVLVEYRSDAESEFVFCAPSLPLPGYRQVCNLTAENYGSSWYCGKPSKPGLLCNDWMMVVPGNHTTVLTALESTIMPLFHQTLPVSVRVHVDGDSEDAKVEPSIKCRERPLSQTWTDNSPVGFFYRNLWYPRHCSNDAPARASLQVHTECLRHRRLLLMGDSTMRYILFFLAKEFGLTVLGSLQGHYHRPTSAYNETLGLSAHWLLHEQPYYTGGFNFFRGHNRAFTAYLDELPPSTTDIVVMHMYQHLTPFHPDVFRSRARRISQSVKALLDRAPNVSVAIKGSHTYNHLYGPYMYAHSDYWGKIYDQIWKEELAPLLNRVLFLDAWDMTLATENSDPHPPDYILLGLMKTLLSYVCGR